MTDTTTIAVDDLVAPLDAAAPCGENLEYDADFLALETALRGAPEVQYGSTITPATPPDWQAVHALALALMARTRDLRIAVALARALLALGGVAGCAQGLALVERLLGEQWDGVHPQLEADDDFDPMLRINVLAALVAPTQLLGELRAAPLVRVRALGSFSLRDIEMARERERAQADGAGEPPAQARTTTAMIDAAFAAAAPDDLAATGAALRAIGESVRAIDGQLARHVGAGSALDLAPLATLAAQALAVVDGHVRDDVPIHAEEAGFQTPAAVPVRTSDPGAIAGSADVVRLLDRLCAYYAEHEPSSPVPLLLQRARRLVDKTFVELLQDLAPDGVSQLARVSGIPHES